MPFRPKRKSENFDSLESSVESRGGLEIPKPNGAPPSGPDAVSKLEAKAGDL